MIVTVYKTDQTLCNLAEVEELVNSFQFFFVMRVAPSLTLPRELLSFAIDPRLLSDWFQRCAHTDDATISVLVTSSRLEHPQSKSIYSHNRRVAVITDHHWRGSDYDTKVLLARHIIQIGMAAFQCHKTPVNSCVCNLAEDFDCLCQGCEDFLRKKDYRDGIRYIKDAFNLLNQFRSSPGTPLPDSPEHSELRLAAAYANEITEEENKLKRPPPFDGFILLIVLHFLSDLIPFIDALKKLGCRYEDMYLIAKPYPYARRDEVDHRLTLKGVNTTRASKSDPVEGCAERVLQDVSRRLKTNADKKILVIEDGGYFAPLLHRPEFYSLLESCIGIVEQTQKGINNDKKIKDILVPILSVAESDFKKIYESPEIGRVTIQNIGRFTPNTKLSGEHAILFGFGSVGQEVAFHLTNTFNMTVSVVDDQELPILRARHRKAIVAEAETNFDNLKFKHDALLVIGSTGSGKPSITEPILKKLRNGAVLVSTSSDREEIDVNALEKLARGRIDEIAMGKEKYTIDDESGGTKSFFLLAEGYPINFYASESLPNDTIDPVMTLLLLCAVELAINFRIKIVIAKGVLKDEVNEITAKRRLVSRFLAQSPQS